jgi:hypothetical protein
VRQRRQEVVLRAAGRFRFAAGALFAPDEIADRRCHLRKRPSQLAHLGRAADRYLRVEIAGPERAGRNRQLLDRPGEVAGNHHRDEASDQANESGRVGQ